MRNNHLLLLTHTYPFGQGEEFLESEINYLTKKFDSIFIFSSAEGGNITRKVPDNVKIYNVHFSRIKRVLTLPTIFLKIDFYAELIHVIITVKFSLKLIKLLLFFYSNSIIKRISILKIIRTKKLSNDNIFVYSYWNLSDAIAAVLLKKDISCISFSRAHGSDLYFETSNINYIPFKKLLYSELDMIFFVSEHGKKYFQDKFKIKDDRRLEVSRLGVKSQEKLNINSSGGIFRIVSCSFISKVKRIDLIIKTLLEVDELKINWVHIGSGRGLREMKSVAEDLLSKKNNISFEFKGYIQNKEIGNYYKKTPIDIFINVSSSEGIPVSIMEAASFGIPIVATNVGGVSEIVDDSNGFLLSANPTTKEIRNAIETILLSDDDQITKLRNNSVNIWNNKYNSSKNYDEFIDRIFELRMKND